MNRPVISLVAALLAIALLTPAVMAQTTQPAEKLPSADDVLAKMVKAAGGEEAFGKVKSRILTGNFVMEAMGMKATITMYATKDKYLQVIEIPGLGEMQQGVNGDTVWSKDPMTGPRLVKGAEKDAFLRENRLNIVESIKNDYKKKEITGVESFNGVQCYVLKMTPKTGNEETWYIDKDTHVQHGEKGKVETQYGEIPATTIMSNYKEVDGIKFPHTIGIDQTTQKFTLSFDKCEHNVEIADAKFELPAEIKALLEKEKAAKPKPETPEAAEKKPADAPKKPEPAGAGW